MKLFGKHIRINNKQSGLAPLQTSARQGSASKSVMGFTIIEVIIVFMVIGILAAGGLGLFAYFAETIFTHPQVARLQSGIGDVLWMMVEGDANAGGLRYAQSIDSVAANSINFTDENGAGVKFRISSDKLQRSLGSGWEDVPYYFSDDIEISGAGGTLFTYLDSEENVTSTAADVRRISINITAQDTSTSDASYAIGTSIRVLMFE